MFYLHLLLCVIIAAILLHRYDFAYFPGDKTKVLRCGWMWPLDAQMLRSRTEVHVCFLSLFESEALCESQPLLQLFIINPHPPMKDFPSAPWFGCHSYRTWHWPWGGRRTEKSCQLLNPSWPGCLERKVRGEVLEASCQRPRKGKLRCQGLTQTRDSAASHVQGFWGCRHVTLCDRESVTQFLRGVSKRLETCQKMGMF